VLDIVVASAKLRPQTTRLWRSAKQRQLRKNRRKKPPRKNQRRQI